MHAEADDPDDAEHQGREVVVLEPEFDAEGAEAEPLGRGLGVLAPVGPRVDLYFYFSINIIFDIIFISLILSFILSSFLFL